jgi:hypothetical protein
MKKLILFAIVSVAVTMASCRKDVNCTCTAEVTTVSSGGSGPTTTIASTQKTTYTQEKIRRKNAGLVTDCNNRTEVNTYKETFQGVTYTDVSTSVYTCELK